MPSKVEILLNEAEKDFNLKLYNKCVSALYFASRMMIELYLKSMNINIPKRDDKLANLIENLGFRSEAESLRLLYELRKKADYRDESINESEAKEALKIASSIIKVFT
jgi:uncharacterized protein (UPF0332 family)